MLALNRLLKIFLFATFVAMGYFASSAQWKTSGICFLAAGLTYCLLEISEHALDERWQLRSVLMWFRLHERESLLTVLLTLAAGCGVTLWRFPNGSNCWALKLAMVSAAITAVTMFDFPRRMFDAHRRRREVRRWWAAQLRRKPNDMTQAEVRTVAAVDVGGSRVGIVERDGEVVIGAPMGRQRESE